MHEGSNLPIPCKILKRFLFQVIARLYIIEDFPFHDVKASVHPMAELWLFPEAGYLTFIVYLKYAELGQQRNCCQRHCLFVFFMEINNCIYIRISQVVAIRHQKRAVFY